MSGMPKATRISQQAKPRLQKRRAFRDPELPTSCDGMYAYAVEKGCLVGCGYDQDCAARCFLDTVAQFPADPICKPQDQEDPCGACQTGCVEFGEQWVQENCQQACPNGQEDWDNPDCSSCMNAGFCLQGKCKEAICREPCGEPDEPSFAGQARARSMQNRLARNQLRKKSLGRMQLRRGGSNLFRQGTTF